MAMEMEAGDLWLPSEFLPNDFFLQLQGEPYYNRGNLRSEFPPVEPALGTESDEEDYLAELTRQMAHAFLKENDEDDELSLLARDDNPKQMMAGSPQSTLCDLGVWSGSGKGSPNGPSQVSSPPSTPFDQGKEDSWDLLTAAAGQVVRLRLNENDGRGLLGPPAPAKVSLPIPAPAPAPAPLKRSATTIGGLYSSPPLTQQQLQAERFYQLKQQQLMKQQASAAWGRQLNRGKCGGAGAGGGGEGHCGRTLGLPCSAWPPLQRQHQHHQNQQGQAGSGMRAVFLTGSRARKESTGTGVFLPRRPGAPSSDVRKKPACSTVLLPDRVIQALNLNLSDMVPPHHPRFPGDSMVARGNAYLAHQKRNQHRPQPVAPTIQEQLRLPAEWTY